MIFQKNRQFVGTIDLGGLDDGGRHIGLIVIAHQQHIECAHQQVGQQQAK